MGVAGGMGRGGGGGGRTGWARLRGRHCPDCGAVLTYYPHLSSPKAPDDRRVLAYSCPECTDDFERPRMVAVRRSAAGAGEAAGAGVDSIDVEIIEPLPAPAVAPGGGNGPGGSGG